MKIAIWNVNGIRVRAAPLHEWLERERPDIVCLQEVKAEQGQIPEIAMRWDYHAFWHCCKGYSGVSLQLRKDTFPDPPAFAHPPFDIESRVVTADLGTMIVASMYVPNCPGDDGSRFPHLSFDAMMENRDHVESKRSLYHVIPGLSRQHRGEDRKERC